MNAKRRSKWDETQLNHQENARRRALEGEIEMGDEETESDSVASEPSAEERAWLAELVRRSREALLVTLTPQPQWRAALREGKSIELNARWMSRGLPADFMVWLEPVASAPGLFRLRSDAWPDHWRPQHLCAGTLWLTEFATESIDFKRTSVVRPGTPVDLAASSPPLKLAAASAPRLQRRKQEEVPRTLRGDSKAAKQSISPLKQPTPSVRLSADITGRVHFGADLGAASDGLFAVAELVVDGNGKRQVIDCQALPLSAEPNQPLWTGLAKFRPPAIFEEPDIRLEVRPFRPDDLWMLSNRREEGSSQVTQFLGAQNYAVFALRSLPGAADQFEFDLAGRSDLLAEECTWILEASPVGKEGK
ncbi:MAG: hypothetical protein ACKV0T_29120 [Planctomycetales bacterium]